MSHLVIWAALFFATALPGASIFAAKLQESPPCESLKCILAFPDMHDIISDGFSTLSPSSFVDVILHFNDDHIAIGRSAAERITGISIDHFVAPNSFAATVPASSLKTLADEPLIRSVTHLLPEQKFSLSDLRRFFSGDSHAPQPNADSVKHATLRPPPPPPFASYYRSQ
jgi:hypothetical protein